MELIKYTVYIDKYKPQSEIQWLHGEFSDLGYSQKSNINLCFILILAQALATSCQIFLINTLPILTSRPVSIS